MGDIRSPEELRALQDAANRSRENARKSGLLPVYDCVLCDNAVHAVVRNGPEAYRVCAYHYQEYAEEGARYLPFDERRVYQRIIQAGRRKDAALEYPGGTWKGFVED